MQKQELKVLIYVKKNAAGKDGLSPVMGRITVGRTVAQFSAKLKCCPELWDSRKGKLKGKSAEAVKINRAIDKINLSINSHYKHLTNCNGTTTAEEVKNLFQGIASAQETLLKFYTWHNDRFAQRVSVDRAKGTSYRFQISLKHLAAFVREKYHVSDMPFTQLDLIFIQSFDYYLRVEKRMQPNTVVGTIANLRKIVRLAVNKGIIPCNPFSGYVLKKPQAHPRSISMEDIERIVHLPLHFKSQIISRDMFLFSCFTGISLIDIYELGDKDFIKEEDGTLWISKHRHKTGTLSRIRLLQPAIDIVEKYRGQKPGFVFPCPKRCTVFRSIKVIERRCGFDSPLRFHQGRHTFASQVCLSQGVPIETVSKMLGHRHIETTQIYAAVSSEKIVRDMQEVIRRLSPEINFIF